MFPQVFKTHNFIQFQLISSEWCELYPKNTRIELINTKSSHHQLNYFLLHTFFLDDRPPNLFLIAFEQTSVIRKQPERKTEKLINICIFSRGQSYDTPILLYLIVQIIFKDKTFQPSYPQNIPHAIFFFILKDMKIFLNIWFSTQYSQSILTLN